MKNQPDLNAILAALNQIQLNYQTLHQKNTELRNILNQCQEEETSYYRNPAAIQMTWLKWDFLKVYLQSPLLEDFVELINKFETSLVIRTNQELQLTKFENLLRAALIDQFRNGLQGDVKDLLLTVEDPISLNDAISKTPQMVTNSTTATEELMQIDIARFKLLTEEEKNRHCTNNLCLYCGELGHIVRNCYKKHNLPLRIDAVVTAEELSGKEGAQLNTLSVKPTFALTVKLHLHLPNRTQVDIEALIDLACGSYSTELLDPSPTLPQKYREFSDMFDKKEADKLPKNQTYNCSIELLPRTQPPWGPIYELSKQELETLRGYIETT
ncbi:13487_t:CDS:2 [Cetraspora pellucida]|uniref:13487_t:CDS:1 n=1 Tax=Cetraspora pellucida TaxID=1433469 RepID=A0A9N9GJT4_9GLOM|nr:13487_t:CDS:2 [Cetraspora pellucida]